MVFDAERAAFFDQLSAHWDATVRQIPDTLIQRVISALAIPANSNILDVGSGTGHMLKYLLDTVPKSLIACDLSQRMLDIIAAKYLEAPGLRLLRADARSLPLASESIDSVLCNGVYPHFESRSAALGELYRVTKPGGRLVISHFGGREFVNNIHGSSSDPNIQKDIIEPANIVADLLTASGFVVDTCYDEPDLLLLAGVKA